MKKFENKMMLNQYDSCRIFDLKPNSIQDEFKDWKDIAWVQFDKPFDSSSGANNIGDIFK